VREAGQTPSEKGDLYAQKQRYEADHDPLAPPGDGALQPRTSRDLAESGGPPGSEDTPRDESDEEREHHG
jgi:hypothetical protein